jgi:hypothetical protein
MKKAILLAYLTVFALNLQAQYRPQSGDLFNVVAGETISASKICYIKSSDGKVYIADTTAAKQAIGIVTTGGSSGDTLQIWLNGLHYLPLGGLQAGKKCYLDASGAITTTKPVHPIQEIGVAYSDSIIMLSIKPMQAGVIDASATLDFANTPAGTKTDLTITATGARVGDYVILSAPAGSEMTSGVYKATVSGDDTVRVSFVNYSSTTSANPASGIFRIQVIKKL